MNLNGMHYESNYDIEPRFNVLTGKTWFYVTVWSKDNRLLDGPKPYATRDAASIGAQAAVRFFS